MDFKVKDVAELLNVSETTIHQWLTEGKIPAYRLNDQYCFSRGEIQNWMMSNRTDHVLHATLKEKAASVQLISPDDEAMTLKG